MFVVSDYHNSPLTLSIWGNNSDTCGRGTIQRQFMKNLQEHFIARANLIVWIQKWYEILKEYIIEQSPIMLKESFVFYSP